MNEQALLCSFPIRFLNPKTRKKGLKFQENERKRRKEKPSRERKAGAESGSGLVRADEGKRALLFRSVSALVADVRLVSSRVRLSRASFPFFFFLLFSSSSLFRSFLLSSFPSPSSPCYPSFPHGEHKTHLLKKKKKKNPSFTERTDGSKEITIK